MAARRSPVVVILLAGLVLASCGSDGEGSSQSGTELDSIEVAYATSGFGPHDLPLFSGPIDYGADFSLQQEESDLTEFASHATAMQTVLGGQAEVLGGSFLSALLAIQEGADLRVFCPGETIFDASFIGLAEVDSLEEVSDPGVRVGVDSAGGAVNYFSNLLFRARGLDFRVEDLETTKVLEDTSLRTSALISGEIDAAMIAQFEVPQVIEELGSDRINILSHVPEDLTEGIFFPFAASKEWLDENVDRTTAFCASVLKASREYSADFSLFRTSVNEHILGGESIDDETLRGTWEVSELLWAQGNTLTEEVVEDAIDVGVEMGLVDADLTYDEVIDPRPIEGAVELLDEE